MTNGNVTVCSGTFYDPQGTSNYADFNGSMTMTFCSADGLPMTFNFTSFNTREAADNLTIYDGPNLFSPSLGTYSITNSPGSIVSSGSCLTFVWTTDNSGAARLGWVASITTSAPAPVNDDICAATSITPDGACVVNQTNNCATLDYTMGCSVSLATVWYSFNLNPGENAIDVTFANETFGGNVEMMLAHGSPDCTAPVGDGALCGPSTDVFSWTGLSDANTYFLSVSTADGDEGDFDICMTDWAQVLTSGASCASPIAIACGDVLTGETTIGSSDSESSWDCLITAGPPVSQIYTFGEDRFYVIDWIDAAAGGTIRLNFSNVVDDDTYMEILYLGTSCTEGTCSSSSQFNIATGTINGASYSYVDISVPAGIQSHYFVIDSQGDGVTSYDMEVTCFSTGIVLDDINNCPPIPGTAPANQGNYCTWQELDGGGIPIGPVIEAPASMDPAPGGKYNICENVYLRNAGWEWLIDFQIEVGDCWTNVTNITPHYAGTPATDDNGFYDVFGEWTASYDAVTNRISFLFDNSTTTEPWGDGNSGGYTCNLYSFCFDADIVPTCSPSDGFQNGIVATDDGIGGAGGTSAAVVTLPSTSPTINVLPIVLVSFEAEVFETNTQSIVQLNWTTQSEINNNYFTIERSKDGLNFEKIGIVQGEGNSAIMHDYSFSDKTPYLGISYYRLRQTDFDEKSEVFNPKSVNISKTSKVQLFPSPTHGNVTIQSEGMEEIIIYNSIGEIIQKYIEIGRDKIVLMLNLKAGVYSVSVLSNGNLTYHRLIVN